MTYKIRRALIAVIGLVIFSLAAISAVLLFGGSEEAFGQEQEAPATESSAEAENNPVYGICTSEEETKAPDYAYLRGTAYKNLIETRYPNLLATTIAEEPAEEEKPAKTGVGAAVNPGYSGSVGSYSMQSKTVAAHLSVQGTSIQNRPIWQCTGNTNYYTNSSVTWAAGSANLRSGPLSQNTVIYGHNWNNCFAPYKRYGSEFESLMSFVYQDFAANNQYIYLTTNSGVHTFRVFAVCFTKDLNFYINCNGIDVASVAARAMNMSLYNFGVGVGSGDKIITLSTCTRYFPGLGANQRFIVMGKLISSE